MILLFTSNHCAWCEVLKNMLLEKYEEFGQLDTIYEVNVDVHYHIAEAYGILVVPTLVAGMQKITGVPTETDLRSFILQITSGAKAKGKKVPASSFLREARKIQKTQVQEESPLRST
ncbi:MAG: thioredoxin family protein [Candidatus Thorarchaeota archaeon]|nr:thioredoxin family protein [Candidatus Thorarchaeota archaeon]